MKKAQEYVARKTGACIDTVHGWLKRKDKLAAFVDERQPGKFAARQRGCTTRVFRLQHTSKGCRLPGKRGYLGRTDHCRELVLKTQVWAEAEQAAGHPLARLDLLRQFRLYLEKAVEQAKQVPEEDQTQKEKAALKVWQTRLAKLQEDRRVRRRQAVHLAAKTGFTERETNLQTSLSQSEEDRRLAKHWQLYDLLLWRAGCGSREDLQDYVAQPEQFIRNRRQTVLTFSDQIPVWLKPGGAGKVLQHRSVQRQVTLRRKRKRAGETVEPVHDHVRGPGCSDADRSAQQHSVQADRAACSMPCSTQSM